MAEASEAPQGHKKRFSMHSVHSVHHMRHAWQHWSLLTIVPDNSGHSHPYLKIIHSLPLISARSPVKKMSVTAPPPCVCFPFPPSRKEQALMSRKFSRPSRFVSTIFSPSFFDPNPVCRQNGNPIHSPGRGCHILPGQRAVFDNHNNQFYMCPSCSSPDCLEV